MGGTVIFGVVIFICGTLCVLKYVQRLILSLTVSRWKKQQIMMTTEMAKANVEHESYLAVKLSMQEAMGNRMGMGGAVGGAGMQ